MLNLYQSNMLDALLTLYLAVRTPSADPLVPEVLLVPSQGMQRWLQLGLARDSGIAANLDFQLPAAFVWRLVTRVFPEVPRRSAWDREVLAWRVLAALDGLPELETAALAANWRSADAAGRFELAWRVADVFDQYLIYRPDWLAAWERGRRLGLGGDEDWQAALWRRLARGSGEAHRARLLDELEAALRGGKVAGLPSRVTVFGVSALPPRFWELLQALALHAEVDLFLLNPSADYWGQLRRGDAGAGAHPLLASLGQQGRDFINTVAASAVAEPARSQFFVSPAEGDRAGRVLAALQSDILHQRLRTDRDRMPLQDGDHSLQVQVCHSALREVEVLHDRLLMLFEENPDLMPDDVLVMCTDMQRYAPLLEAVFATRHAPVAIPFSIADRRLETEEPLLARVAELLALPGSRFEVERVLALLEEPALRACFGLEDGDVPLLRRWCEELHLRWGRDGADRRARGLPDDVPLTWRDGLARLQLGFALPVAAAPDDDARFAGTAPLDAVPGLGQARVLARFALFVEALLADWADTFAALLEDFFAETADSRAALQKVREALTELREQAARAPEAGAQPFAVLRRWLARWLTGLESRRGFLHGAVTCCAMVPLRSLPFRVIAVLGMDDGAFPRQQKPWPFDLMAEHGRPGDRSRRQDDRYLFLETLLAARDVLYLSYGGQSEIDGSVRPPSPVLAELLDQARATVAATEAEFDANFVTHHALQPFSPRYFSGRENLFSFAPHFAAASRLVGRAPTAATAAFSAPLPPPSAELLTLTPARFEQFLAHPPRFFLRERLGVQLPRASAALPDEEPVDITDRRALRRELFRFPARGADSLRAAGLLPGGAWGAGLWREEDERMRQLHGRLAALGATPRPALAVDIEIDGVRWCGPLGDVTDAGLVRVAVEGPVYASDLLRLQFAHLLLCALAPADVAPTSRIVRADHDDVVLAPLHDATALLADFAAALREGLCLPLPLFRRASPVYAKRQSLVDAGRAYAGNEFTTGDESDAWIALLWRGTDALGDRFCDWADRLYGPLLDALEQL